MVHFVGAGCGAADLITVRGMKLLEKADVVIYAGSLVNPELLSYTKEACEIYNSATMTLEEVIEVMRKAESQPQLCQCARDIQTSETAVADHGAGSQTLYTGYRHLGVGK